MVELFEGGLVGQSRKSSKGNQLKWKSGELWYKADYTGYEGLSEYLISHLLTFSGLSAKEICLYDTEEIRCRNSIFRGCRSRDFRKGDRQIITLERLYSETRGESLHRAMWKFTDCADRLRFLTDSVIRMTGLREFGIYLGRLMTIDALFLNEDRHLHNIAVMMDSRGNFDYCPVFDNGAGLLSDTTLDYPMGGDIFAMMKAAKGETVSDSFDEQLDTAESLYGNVLSFSFSAADVDRLLCADSVYPDDLKERVRELLSEQMRKYRYLFR